MKANFDPDLKFRSDGRWLEACGPLIWIDPGGLQGDKVVVAVRINQNGVIAHGISDEFDKTITDWMIMIRPAPGQKFQTGTAQGVGVLTVTHPPPGSTPPGTFSWHDSPQLHA